MGIRFPPKLSSDLEKNDQDSYMVPSQTDRSHLMAADANEGPQVEEQPNNVLQWPSQQLRIPPSGLSHQQQLRTRQKHHVSLPPVYYSTTGLSPSPSAHASYTTNSAAPVPVGLAGSVPYQLGTASNRYTQQSQQSLIQPKVQPPLVHQHSQQQPLQPYQQSSALPSNLGQPIQHIVQHPPQMTQNQLSGSVAPRIQNQTQQQITGPIIPFQPAYASFHSPSHTPSPLLTADGTSHAPPRLRRIQSWSQLEPTVIKVPKNRRAKPEGGFMSPLLALTTYLPSTYNICDPRYQYNQMRNPRRVLTEPHEGQLNNGFDNVNSDYILYVNDILGVDDNRRYLALNLLGKGTFGQVVKCQNMATMEVVAVKVVKNKPAFLNQSMMEVSILEHIQQNVDKDDAHNLLRLKDRFMHKEHLCLVFELLSSNLYEVIKKNKFKGLGINVVRSFSQQLLDSLSVLKGANLIHCDLKPENILLKRHDGLAIKVIDFGSACHERQTVYTYIQSRFYRSPEVILGLPYTSSIDMWSLGCIIAELFLGLPIFPGSSEYNQWSRIVESLGLPPTWMLDMGKNTNHFMEKTPQGVWKLRAIVDQNLMFKTEEKVGKKYFATTDIHETIMGYPFPRNDMTPAEIEEELKQRECLSDFVRGLLTFNPFERWTPQQAAMHPFISRQHYVGPFSPQNNRNALSTAIDPTHYRAAQNLAQAYAQAQDHVQSQQAAHQTSFQLAQPMAHGVAAPPLPQPVVPVQPSYAQQATVPTQQFPIVATQTQSGYYAQQPSYPLPRADQRLVPQPLRGRSATIGQVTAQVPAPIQQAAARVDPSEFIQGHSSPAYFPPRDFYQGV